MYFGLAFAGAAVFLVEKLNKQNGVRGVHEGGHEKQVIFNSAAGDTPTLNVVESSNGDENTDEHLRQLKKSDALCSPGRNTYTIGSQSIVRVHERVDKEVHSTEYDSDCVRRVNAVNGVDEDGHVVIPMEER